MGALAVEVDAAEVGLDPERLLRIDRHFTRYVEDGRLPGWLVTVSRHGRLAYVASYGSRDLEAGLLVTDDTIWRIYSMTKPVTSVAAMMLYEEGLLGLSDPLSRYIPSFADVRVYAGGSDMKPVAVEEPVRIWHLMTHTAGLTYDFHRIHPVDAIYRASGFEFGMPPGMDLAQVCDALAAMPLLFQPGTEWNYSMATDVLGRVVEVVSGQDLATFFKTRILDPLGMTDTAFWSADERLAALYTPGPGGRVARLEVPGAAFTKPPAVLGGGGGLVSTAADYHRFTQMLLGLSGSPAGELDGARLLSPRTVSYMTRNHLPGGQDLAAFGRRLFADDPLPGIGFGLGFAIVVDPVPGKVVTSAGEYHWGGAASTEFWIDPAQELTAAFYTQLIPSTSYPIRNELRRLVYQAFTD